MKREWWLIDIENYGDYAFYGTEEEAEIERAGRAEWEGERGTKKRISAYSSEVVKAARRLRNFHDEGRKLEPNELEAIGVTDE